MLQNYLNTDPGQFQIHHSLSHQQNPTNGFLTHAPFQFPLMSRLTASPFVKPSPLDFARRPLTPPETTVNEHAHSISVAGVPEQPRPSDVESVASALAQDPGARFRRVSSLAYHSTGLRDARERSTQKSFKSFIIVTPPPSFLNEYGQLGHTLSSGPSHRLSQGLLMPLFPTVRGRH